MSTSEPIKIEVHNERSFGKLGPAIVYMTPEVKNTLSKEKTKSRENLFDLFKKGRALRGFKHLVEKVREKDPKSKIIFTHGQTKKENGAVYINYNDYKKSAGEKFFSFYREIGLDAAGYFLNKNFPGDYTYDRVKVSNEDIKKLDRNFSLIMDRVPKKRKNQRVIIEQTSKIITELSAKRKLLKQEVDDLENLRNKSNVFFFQNRLEEMKTRLSKSYPETKGKNSWQTWIYKNNWLFGTNYQTPIEKQKINITGSMPDFLFPTMDGFLDILEIKLPTKEIIVEDTNHSGAYAWSSDTNKAIGQVVKYLNDIELYQLQIRREIKRVYSLDIFLIKPRAFILIGNKKDWTEEQHEALRNLNYSLHGIEVISYSDLLLRGQEILDIYTKKYETS